MALKDTFRRAIGRTSDTRSSSSSTSSTRGTTSPSDAPLSQVPTVSDPPTEPTPNITLTKSSTRLGLSKTLSFHHGHKSHPSKEEKQHEKAEKQWRKQDEEEWKVPKPGRRRDVKCQNTLRAFDFGSANNSKDFRKGSACSGVSPCASARASVDVGPPGASALRNDVADAVGDK